ncbi:hypothetical protein HWI79_3667 [Cryptosporidium felis]|nr:hypothetical protein HWI79_3667 [Cryptosporidium felis]
MRQSTVPIFTLCFVFFLRITLSFGTSSYSGFSSVGKGEISVSSYDQFSRSSCEESAVPFNELIGFGRAEVANFKCPANHQISGLEYITDSLGLYITGIRFVCDDNTSSFHVGSEAFSPGAVKGSYLKGGIHEFAFGYDTENPILRLIQVVKEETFPKGSKKLISFVSPGEQLFRSQTFLGSLPTLVCAVIITNSKFQAPIIGNIRIHFQEKRPLYQNKYIGLIYTGTPNITLSSPDPNNCNKVTGASPSTTKDTNFHVKCPEGFRIIGIDAILGDKISSNSLKSVSNQLIGSIKQSLESKNKQTEDEDEVSHGSDKFINSLGSTSEGSPNSEEVEDIVSGNSVNNGEILMLRFLCSDYISSFSIGQPLSNITSWNLQDKIPKLDDWENSPILLNSSIEKLIKETAERHLVLGTREVRLGNINSVLLGYSTEKLLVKAYLEDFEDRNKKKKFAEYVERFTFGPVFININEFVDQNFRRRNILKLAPEIYKSNPINSRINFTGSEFKGICGKIMYSSYLISSLGFDVSKTIKPYFPQIFFTPGIKVNENNGGTFKCNNMLHSLIDPEGNLMENFKMEVGAVRSSLRSFQGSLKCPVGLSIEKIQLLLNKQFGTILAAKFICGSNPENYFTIGMVSQMENELKAKQRGTRENPNTEIVETLMPRGEHTFDEIQSIVVAISKRFYSNSVLIPESNLPISIFEVIQKSVSENSQNSKAGLNFTSNRYPPNLQTKMIWNNGVLTQVCAEITSGGSIKNIGFWFEHPFQPTSKKEISENYGFSSEGEGELDLDKKDFICPGVLHSPRAQLLFSKHIEEIITGGLRSKSKKTLLRSINYKCPGNSVINRVEVAWELTRGSGYASSPSYNSENSLIKRPVGSIGAMRFFCSDGKSVFKVGSDTTPTHSKKNIEIHEVLIGYKELTNEEIKKTKLEITKENSIKVTEELLRTLPGDPIMLKLVHESLPVSKIQLNVEETKLYESADEVLSSLKNRKKPQNLKSRIWKGGRWKGVCIGLLNLSGGIFKSHEFSIVSFGAYFEKPSPLVMLPFKGFIQTGIPQIHQNKIVSTCDLTTPPSYGLKYPGFSAAFLCPNGTNIERIGYSTIENNSNQGFDLLKNGTLILPPAFREQRHNGPLSQITALHLFCSDGITTITIGQPSKSVSISKPGKISAIKVGYVRPNSSLLDRNISPISLLLPASLELVSKEKNKLLKYSNPNFPEYTQKYSVWEGEDLQAVCVDYAIIDDHKSAKNSNRGFLRWAGNAIKYPEKYVIMSVGFAFRRRIVRSKIGGAVIPPKKIKVAESIPKVKLKADKVAKKYR